MQNTKNKSYLLVLLLTVGFALAIVPAFSAPASEAAPVTELYVNKNVKLDATYPYFLQGSNTHSATGTLGGDATAYLNVSTGTLTLQGYNSGQIQIGVSQDYRDLTIKLIGANTIAPSPTTSLMNGIQRLGEGGITITSDDPANSLAINLSSSSDVMLRGIFSAGELIIKDKAKVTVSSTNNNLNYTNYGIDTVGLKVLGEADLTVTVASAGDASRTYGLYTTRAALPGADVSIFNTTGTITIDASAGGLGSSACYGDITLIKAAKLTLKWRPGSGMFRGGPFKDITYDPAHFSVQTLPGSVTYTMTDMPVDTTPPTLSGGTVNRTSDTKAAIGFTADKAGNAYYLVQAGGAAAPTSAAVKAGGSLGPVTSGSNTGKEITMTGGAKDVYVVVEDVAGNISEPLKISVQAWKDNSGGGGGGGGSDGSSGGLSGSEIAIIAAGVVLSLSAVGFVYWFFKIKP